MEPSSSDPKLIAFIYGVAVAVVGWFGAAFSIGRKLTAIELGLSERIGLTEEKVKTIKDQQEINKKSIEKLTNIEGIVNQVKEKQNDYDETLKRIDMFLLPRNGKPTFITSLEHDVISDNCRKQIVLEISLLISNQWEKHRVEVNEAVNKISETVQTLAVQQAHLSERHRFTDKKGNE